MTSKVNLLLRWPPQDNRAREQTIPTPLWGGGGAKCSQPGPAMSIARAARSGHRGQPPATPQPATTIPGQPQLAPRVKDSLRPASTGLSQPGQPGAATRASHQHIPGQPQPALAGRSQPPTSRDHNVAREHVRMPLKAAQSHAKSTTKLFFSGTRTHWLSLQYPGAIHPTQKFWGFLGP